MVHLKDGEQKKQVYLSNVILHVLLWSCLLAAVWVLLVGVLTSELWTTCQIEHAKDMLNLNPECVLGLNVCTALALTLIYVALCLHSHTRLVMCVCILFFGGTCAVCARVCVYFSIVCRRDAG